MYNHRTEVSAFHGDTFDLHVFPPLCCLLACLPPAITRLKRGTKAALPPTPAAAAPDAFVKTDARDDECMDEGDKANQEERRKSLLEGSWKRSSLTPMTVYSSYIWQRLVVWRGGGGGGREGLREEGGRFYVAYHTTTTNRDLNAPTCVLSQPNRSHVIGRDTVYKWVDKMEMTRHHHYHHHHHQEPRSFAFPPNGTEVMQS